MNTMPEKLTQENFDRLPLTLSRCEFQHWSGLSDETLDDAVESGALRVWHPAKGRVRRYLKTELARICGLRVLSFEEVFQSYPVLPEVWVVALDQWTRKQEKAKVA